LSENDALKELVAKSFVLQKHVSAMAEGFYRLFWKNCGTHGLSVDQKINVLTKLCSFSLRYPYWQYGEDDEVDGFTLSDHFPELIPAALCKKHTHLKKLSGLILYVMHMEIAEEVFQLAREGKITQEQLKRIQDGSKQTYTKKKEGTIERYLRISKLSKT